MDVNGITGTNPALTIRTTRVVHESTPEATAAPATLEQARKSNQEHRLPDQKELAKVHEARQRQVMKPTSVSPEERLKQVLSLDDVKRLLHLYIPYRIPPVNRIQEAQKGGGSGSRINLLS